MAVETRTLILPAEAQRIVRADLGVLPAEPTRLHDLCGRVLAEPIGAAEDLPPFYNSAMDGYAVRSQDAGAVPVSLRVVGQVASGALWDRPLAAGEALRIMTGAPMPPGADAVVRVEDTGEAQGLVEIRAAATPGDNVRPAGEDYRRGDEALSPGTVLTPVRVGVLAALGRTSALAIRPARVAILATGNELIEPGEPLAPGKVRNSNAYGLYAQVLEAGAVPVPLGVCGDDFDRTLERVEAALEIADVLVTSGGVSMGRHDHVGRVLARLGEVFFTAVAQMPGKPLTFARVFGKPAFGLPGNPVSTLVNFELYVRPVLRLLMGHEQPDRPRQRLPLGEPITRKPAGKALYARVTLRDGKLWLTGPQGSGLWQSLAKADGLAIVPVEDGPPAAGTVLEFVPLA
ncbi:MAG: molybdopterin molybdotransferase MoeA [Candidatus Sericytochromatia bacterium]|nr:molybdopterin molybdotransferase MoeA [Candidatus Tanganyikabacteria bacterium]